MAGEGWNKKAGKGWGKWIEESTRSFLLAKKVGAQALLNSNRRINWRKELRFRFCRKANALFYH